MLISKFSEFFSQLSKGEVVLEIDVKINTASADVYYITAGTAGGSLTASHFCDAISDRKDSRLYAGTIKTGTYVPETGETSVSLYAVMEV